MPIGLGPAYEVPGKMISNVSTIAKLVQKEKVGSNMVWSPSYFAAYTSMAIAMRSIAQKNHQSRGHHHQILKYGMKWGPKKRTQTRERIPEYSNLGP